MTYSVNLFMPDQLEFYKYEGAGNDFVLLDNRSGRYSAILAEQQVKQLCDRRFGIGGDGLMALQESAGFDFEMLYFNSDGRPGTMCGNGGRCIAAFAKHLGIVDGEMNFLAVDGPHYAKISDDGQWIRLQIKDVSDYERDGSAYVLNTGSPHYVLTFKDLSQKDVLRDGRTIRTNDVYKQDGINVNFVEDMGDHYFVRTFERGVEDETYACGTGVTAVALAMAISKGQTGSITSEIKAVGGRLKVSFEYDGSTFTSVFLEGPAKLVFTGHILISTLTR